MQERYLGRITPDMDVCDMNGDKIGTVAHVYRHEIAAVAAGMEGSAPGEDIIEVKTGFLGLGKRLYVPLSAVHDTTEGCIFLSRTSEEIQGMGWDQPPAYLDSLR